MAQAHLYSLSRPVHVALFRQELAAVVHYSSIPTTVDTV